MSRGNIGSLFAAGCNFLFLEKGLDADGPEHSLVSLKHECCLHCYQVVIYITCITALSYFVDVSFAAANWQG